MGPRERPADVDLVLIGGREKCAIVIVDYGPKWPERFEFERERGTTIRRSSATCAFATGFAPIPTIGSRTSGSNESWHTASGTI